MGGAFAWGILAASSLVIGALVALWFHLSLRVIGLIMGFGAGVLISAASFDLIEEAADKASGSGSVAVGVFAGCLGKLTTGSSSGSAGVRARARPAIKKAAPRWRSCSAPCSTGSRSMVIGLTIFEGGEVGATYLAAVFISNLPESISSTSGLVTSGWKKSRVLWMWIAIAVVCGLASLSGYALFRAPHRRSASFSRSLQVRSSPCSRTR